jgi:hypothetical protein
MEMLDRPMNRKEAAICGAITVFSMAAIIGLVALLAHYGLVLAHHIHHRPL